MKKLMFAAAALLTAATVSADDHIEHKVMSDSRYEANVAKAVKKLEARGYRVIDVDADGYRGRPALDVEAVKNNREYDIKLSYPDLRIIYERIDN